MGHGSFRPWENEKGKFFPFNFDPNFSSWVAPATSTFFKIFLNNLKRMSFVGYDRSWQFDNE